MRRIGRMLAATLAMILLLGMFVPASAAEVSAGLTFSDTDVYRWEKADIPLPATYEATVSFPADFDPETRGGIIVGNFSENTCGFNFEIHKNGNPRVYITDPEGTVYDIIFTDISVYTGKTHHVAITAQWETGTWQCYLDGKLQQTVTAEPVTPFSFTDTLCLGGDLRKGNTMYFRGLLRNLALYEDVRTPEEIAAEASTASPEEENLLAGYDFSAIPIDTDPVANSAVKGPEFTYKDTRLWFDSHEPIENADYSFALVGDIQILTLEYPDKLPKVFDWLLENKDAKQIAHVFHLGDITDDCTAAEWKLAKEQYTRLNDVLPYSFVRGNHDKIGKFNKHMTYEAFGRFVDGSCGQDMCNTYQTITAGGIPYLILNLDITASDHTYAWAGEVIKQHPHHNVIVTTHIYLDQNGNRITSLKYDATNTAQDLWDEFLSQYENIVMVFCGHAPTDQIVVRKDTGVHGNEVTQILVDPQGTDKSHEAAGLVALLHFSDGGKHVEVEYYATVKEKYFLASNQFSFDVAVVPPEETPEETTLPPETQPEPTQTLPEPTETTPPVTLPAEDTPALLPESKPASNYLLIILLAISAGLNVILFIWAKGKKKR